MTTAERGDPHICVVLLTGLGDVVHGLPLINAIRDGRPGVKISWVAEPMPASFLRGHSSIDEVVVFRRRDGMSGLRDLWSTLRGQRFDITLNLNVYVKSVWPTLLSRAPRRIGFDKGRSFEGVWLAANEHLEPRPRAHTADMFLEFADKLRIPVSKPEWRIELSQEEAREQAVFLGPLRERPIATIVPATATIKKDWVTERWAQVADSLEKDFGFSVVIGGGPGEREQAIGRDILARSTARTTWGMSDSVRRLTAIIAGSNLVLAPDTGPVHIARALGIPVVGLYAHTNPWRVGPWRAYEDLWVDHYTEPNERPDPANRTPKWDRMPTIAVTEVLERVQRAVDKYGAARQQSDSGSAIR